MRVSPAALPGGNGVLERIVVAFPYHIVTIPLDVRPRSRRGGLCWSFG